MQKLSNSKAGFSYNYKINVSLWCFLIIVGAMTFVLEFYIEYNDIALGSIKYVTSFLLVLVLFIWNILFMYWSFCDEFFFGLFKPFISLLILSFGNFMLLDSVATLLPIGLSRTIYFIAAFFFTFLVFDFFLYRTKLKRIHTNALKAKQD